MDPLSTLRQLPDRVVGSVITAFVLGAWPYEFDFMYDPSWQSCEWDI
jgi:hypothetical protein